MKKWLIPVVVIGIAGLIGAGILWTNRATYCQIYHNLPLICGELAQLPPPEGCGRACSDNILSNSMCPTGLTCTNGFCDAALCGNSCGQVCSSDADCDSGFSCLPQGSDPDAPRFCANESCPVPLPEILPHSQCGELCRESLDYCVPEVADCHVAFRCAPGLTCDMGVGGRVPTREGGICLGAPCGLGCWSACRNDDDCADGLTCQHDPGAPETFGFCQGSVCPENRPCINGDGACDPTCEEARLAANPETFFLYSTQRDGSFAACIDAYACTSGECITTIGCFIARDSDCAPVTPTPTAGLPPGAGGAPSEPTFTPVPGNVSCGSPCTSDAQCAGLGPNPACAGGACYDAQTCGGGTTGGDQGGTDGGAVDCSAVGQRCNLDPNFGACPADYTCGGPYDEFNYGTCQRSGCP